MSFERAPQDRSLQKQVEALTAGFQKISAQLQLIDSLPQTVVNAW
jgi:hypothetical protein